MKSGRLRTVTPWLWLLPAGCLLIPFFVIPLAVVIRNSVYIDDPDGLLVPAFTFANYTKVLTDPYYLEVFIRTLGLAVFISALSFAIAFPFAQFLASASGMTRQIVFWAVYLPLYVSVIMRVFGWIVILADSGMINQSLRAMGFIHKPLQIMMEADGMSIGLIHRYLPLMIVPLATSLRKVDPALLLASANLGASRWYSWRHITLPLSLPGAVAGTQLVFAGVLSDYVIPLLMGSTRFQMAAPAIYYEATTNSAWALSGAMATLMLASVAVVLLLANLLLRRIAPWAAAS